MFLGAYYLGRLLFFLFGNGLLIVLLRIAQTVYNLFGFHIRAPSKSSIIYYMKSYQKEERYAKNYFLS